MLSFIPIGITNRKTEPVISYQHWHKQLIHVVDGIPYSIILTNLKKPNLISKIDILIIKGKRIFNIDVHSTAVALRTELAKAGFSKGVRTKDTVNSGDIIGPNAVIHFLKILNKFEPIDIKELLKTMGIMNEMENKLLSAADKCDVEAIEAAYQVIKNCGIKVDLNEMRNAANETPLMLAAAGRTTIPHGQAYEAVALLISLGADPRATANDGRTALMHAASFGRASVAKLLIDNVPPHDRKKYIDQRDHKDGVTAMTYAKIRSHTQAEYEASQATLKILTVDDKKPEANDCKLKI